MLASKNKTSTSQVHFTSSNKTNGSVRVISGKSTPIAKAKVRWYWRLFNWFQRLFK